MKIFICCSKHFYGKIPPIKHKLEGLEHVITLPNSFDSPFMEEEVRKAGKDVHAQWKAKMMREQLQKVAGNDALLVLNFDKNNQSNYVGGATFLEMYEAWKLHKGIYLYNPIPTSILTDEIKGFNPVVINQDLSLIR